MLLRVRYHLEHHLRWLNAFSITKTTSEPRATFLSIPYETRALIYTFSINDSPPFNPYDQNPPLHSMLLVNRQIHDEYVKIYYGSNIFHLYMRRRTADDHTTPNTSGLA